MILGLFLAVALAQPLVDPSPLASSLPACATPGGPARDQRALDDRVMACTAVIMNKAATPAQQAIAWRRRGEAFLVQGDPDRAIVDFGEAIRLEPGDASAYEGRGRAFAAKGDPARARTDYGKALTLDPKLALAWLDRGLSPGGLPAAVFRDPPVDAAHPASGGGVQFTSHGAVINAQLYRPAGAGPHPTVILLHGLPGNEQNLDLARAIQRAGWTVITFHYRGSWGSGGSFTLSGGPEDAAALLAELQKPERAVAWGVDPHRIVLIGHSYGGYVAAANAGGPGVGGVVLIAPWDISYDQRAWVKLTAAERAKTVASAFDDTEGRLGPVTVASLADDLMTHGAELDLAKTAPRLASQPVLILTATRDDPDDQALDLLPTLRAEGSRRMATEQMDTDHGFNDHRIALETTVLHWLAHLKL
jgi:pimeloyl-ACP methyl ester carboxylesterase